MFKKLTANMTTEIRGYCELLTICGYLPVYNQTAN